MKYSIHKIFAIAFIVHLSFLFSASLQAQIIPAGVNFQAIARNASGAILANAAVQVRVSILDGNASGTVLGSYTYQKTTDAYGQFTVAIGTDATIANSGATLGAINWTAASRFIKVEYQPGTSGGFTLVSNSEATASFYAFAAKTAAGLSITGSNGDVLKYNGSNWAATSFVAPTVTTLTSGSGTYTTPANVKYIKVRMVGGGGGGSGSGVTSGGIGSAGGATIFGSSLLTANGGAGGTGGGNTGGIGGIASISLPAISIVSLKGANGQGGGTIGSAAVNLTGGMGGSSFFGSAGAGSVAAASGISAISNSGSGGGGAGSSTTLNMWAGSGGGAGGFIEALLTPGTYNYSIGLGGSGGAAGTSGFAGGSGGSGIIIIEEYYQ